MIKIMIGANVNALMLRHWRMRHGQGMRRGDPNEMVQQHWGCTES
jgi:hypothetical protein